MTSNVSLAYLPNDQSQLGYLVGTKPSANPSKEATQLEPLPQTSKQLLTERVQFATLCWSIIVTGWNDGSTGPLIPRIQSVYGVSHLFLL